MFSSPGADQDVFLGTKKGKSIRFKEEEVRETGRVARGVRGILMDKDDAVVGMEIPAEGCTLLTISEKGYGKRTKYFRIPTPKPRWQRHD